MVTPNFFQATFEQHGLTSFSTTRAVTAHLVDARRKTLQDGRSGPGGQGSGLDAVRSDAHPIPGKGGLRAMAKKAAKKTAKKAAKKR